MANSLLFIVKNKKGNGFLFAHSSMQTKLNQIMLHSSSNNSYLQCCRIACSLKKKDDTALRVLYQGNFQVDCSNCCKRLFITFNGAECSGPLPIETVLWLRRTGYDYHLPGSLEGYCNNIHKGKIRVGINSGNCPGYGYASGVTAWNVVSRMIIEEVPRSQ